MMISQDHLHVLAHEPGVNYVKNLFSMVRKRLAIYNPCDYDVPREIPALADCSRVLLFDYLYKDNYERPCQ